MTINPYLVALVGILLGTAATLLWLRFRRQGPDPTLTHFVYVSDTKVDMLFEQVGEPFSQRLAHELRVNLSMLSYKITQSPNPASTRWGRLQAVLNKLEHDGDIGAIASASPYFRGTLSMKQGTYETTAKTVFDAVLFTGRVPDGTVVALGGTAQHLIGYVGEETESNSGLRGVLKGLHRASLAERELHEGDVNDWMAADAWGAEVREVWEQTEAPTQEMEFVALRLREGSQDPYQRAVLGSPLYVALAKPEQRSSVYSKP